MTDLMCWKAQEITGLRFGRGLFPCFICTKNMHRGGENG
jgi:hypothetical protein